MAVMEPILTPPYPEERYKTTLEKLLRDLPPADREKIPDLAQQIVRHAVSVDREKHIAPAFPARNDDEIKHALAGKNFLVMCGGGKDSEFGLAAVRTAQLMLKEKYGVTFKLRVGVGRQPGMFGVYENLENAFKALGLKDDPLTDIFYIDGKKTSPYVPHGKIPPELIESGRRDVLLNAHIFGGAGRRTFCDNCNMQLASWIATGLAYKGGADMYTTGDAPHEIEAQVNKEVAEKIEGLGGEIPARGNLSPVQYPFAKLDAASCALAHAQGKPEEEANRIDYASIPHHAQYVSVFPPLGYESRDRFDFLKKTLKFDYHDKDTLMFSFTESDCGNPAIMCHLYGLIAEHVYEKQILASHYPSQKLNPPLESRSRDRGQKAYAEGVRAYRDDLGLPMMVKKGFPDEMIEEMKMRYEGEQNIVHMRKKVEAYAKEAYGLTPENMIAMVYAPFTEKGRNLDRYLGYLDQTKPSKLHLEPLAGHIRDMLAAPDGTVLHSNNDQNIISELQKMTGLKLSDMRKLYTRDLEIDNFDPSHGPNKPGSLLPVLQEKLYSQPITFRDRLGKPVATIDAHGR